ncbi:MAG TPA: DUF3626 domain-containing protein [Micromonosporaceae bacterium]
MSFGMTRGQSGALGYVRAVASTRRAEALARIGDDVDIEGVCAAIRGHGRVTLNFHPDRVLADGRTVAEALAADERYRSQFETQISNGGLSAYPGGDRDVWEHHLFGAAYHDGTAEPADRPKYGALNLFNHPDGGAPRFGSCHLRLRPAVNAWSTFTFGDSHLGPADVGTIDAFLPVLAALFEDVRTTGTALGVPVDDLQQRLCALVSAPVGADESMAPSRSLDHYIEAQVHGPVLLAEHAEAFVLDPSFRDTRSAQFVQAAAARAGIGVEWNCGFEMSVEQVPNDFRGAEMPAFARAVADRVEGGGRLDAAIVGRAAVSVAHDPSAWDGWDEPLQLVKYLWHILVAYGEPAG